MTDDRQGEPNQFPGERCGESLEGFVHVRL